MQTGKYHPVRGITTSCTVRKSKAESIRNPMIMSGESCRRDSHVVPIVWPVFSYSLTMFLEYSEFFIKYLVCDVLVLLTMQGLFHFGYLNPFLSIILFSFC